MDIVIQCQKRGDPSIGVGFEFKLDVDHLNSVVCVLKAYTNSDKIERFIVVTVVGEFERILMWIEHQWTICVCQVSLILHVATRGWSTNPCLQCQLNQQNKNNHRQMLSEKNLADLQLYLFTQKLYQTGFISRQNLECSGWSFNLKDKTLC